MRNAAISLAMVTTLAFAGPPACADELPTSVHVVFHTRPEGASVSFGPSLQSLMTIGHAGDPLTLIREDRVEPGLAHYSKAPVDNTTYLAVLSMPGFANQTVEIHREQLLVANPVEMPYVDLQPVTFAGWTHKHTLFWPGVGSLALLAAGLAWRRLNRVVDHSRKFGPYHLGQVLGEGPKTVVYRVETEDDYARSLAVKILRGNDAAFRQTLERDAARLRDLIHPGLTGLHKVLESGGQFGAIVEYAPGVTLEGAIAEGLPLSQRVDLFVQMADALACAHIAGVVHGHLKTSNVRVGPEGKAKVLDCGIPGSPEAPYAAPEQPGATTAASDQYALGVMLRQLVSDAGGKYEAVVARMTATDPGQRYPDVESAARAVRLIG